MTLVEVFDSNVGKVQDATWDDYQQALLAKSLGHIGWLDGYEYFCHSGQVRKAHWTCVIDVSLGIRGGSRFEGYLNNPTPNLIKVLKNVLEPYGNQ
jgi:hypothetical protein